MRPNFLSHEARPAMFWDPSWSSEHVSVVDDDSELWSNGGVMRAMLCIEILALHFFYLRASRHHLLSYPYPGGVTITSLTEFLNNDDSKGRLSSGLPGVMIKFFMKISLSDTRSELRSRERASSYIVFSIFQILITFLQ
jgi:hypothetical protein